MEYGFFNSVNGDRKYNARDISRYFEHIISSGLYKSISACMKVSAAGGMSLFISPGAGLIDSQWFRNEKGMSITVGAAHAALPRIDSVVVRLDLSDAVRSIALEVVAGTPSAVPAATPPVHTDKVQDLVLAHVYVNAGATEITDANITDTRANEEICGWAQSLVDAPLLTVVSSVYTTTAGTTSVVPVNVAGYNAAMDILNVYKGGLRLTPGYDYTLDRDTQRITLAESVPSGTDIAFEALKPVQADTLPEAVELMQSVFDVVSGYNERIVNAESYIETLDAELDEVRAEIPGVATYAATIPASGWAGSAAPYSVSVSISGITADDTPIVDIVQTGNENTDSAVRDAWGVITRITTAAGSITAYASEKPGVSIPIQLKVVR